MRKLLLIAFVFAIAGCAEQQWNKQTLVNDCLRDFNKKEENKAIFNTVQSGIFCDCVADKLLAKYKSARESNKDEAGATIIGKECALEVMSR